MKLQTAITLLGLVGASVVGAAPVDSRSAPNAEYKKIIGKRQFYPVYGVSESDDAEVEKRQFYPVYGVDENDKVKRQFYPVYGVDENDKAKRQFYPVYGVDENNKAKRQFYPVDGVDDEDVQKRQFYPVSSDCNRRLQPRLILSRKKGIWSERRRERERRETPILPRLRCFGD
ncbi:hypothetical protein AC578_2971 [Pseudocercospora eumusae]|uniref:Uncharacterized protein n=1 Tax=Pseudocercospora eumusae TaxID=321146 RepID=A0A139HEL9_9PEZI|nr:hypothetical protein AC578_2971 [Pseudocercospora eumusae]